jgi:hypothetical protein
VTQSVPGIELDDGKRYIFTSPKEEEEFVKAMRKDGYRGRFHRCFISPDDDD